MGYLFDAFNQGQRGAIDNENASVLAQLNKAKLEQTLQDQDLQNQSRQVGMQIAQTNLAKQTQPAVNLSNIQEVPDAGLESMGKTAEVAIPTTAKVPKQSELLSQQADELKTAALKFGSIGNIQQQTALMKESDNVREKLYLTQKEERTAEAQKQKEAAGAVMAVNSQEALDNLWGSSDPEHRKSLAPLFNIGLDGKPIYDEKGRAALDYVGNKVLDSAKQNEFKVKAINQELAVTKAENDRLNKEALIRQVTERTAIMREGNKIKADALAKKPDLSAPTLTPEAIQAQAEQMNTGKPLPTRLDPATRSAIINKATELALANGGSTADTPAKQAEFKANSGALAAVTKDLSAITPYKEMLDTNIGIAKQLATKAIATDSRFANKTINWLRQNATDNPDVSEYLAQVHFVSTEAARVLTNPRLVGQLTDSAISDMKSVISGDMPLESTVRVLDRVAADGQNRVKAMEDQHANLVKKMSGTPNRRATDNAPSADNAQVVNQLKTTGTPYEPDKYNYRINPANGLVQRAPK